MEPTKAYLRRIREQYKIINRLSEQCDTLRFSLGAAAIRYDKDVVQSSPRDVVSDTMMEILELQERIITLSRHLDSRRFDALQVLMQIPDQTQRDVIRLYYLDAPSGIPRTWDAVAAQIGMSTKYVIRRIHPEALIAFDKIRRGN